MKIKKILPLLLPIAIPVLLFAPYSFFNQLIIVDLLGCGCEPFPNANHFSLLFWGAMGILNGGLSFFVSKRITPKWAKILYILVVIIVVLLLCNAFYRALLWK